MVEYGGGINQGPAGQVSGGSGLGGSTDFFGNVSHTVNDVANYVAAQPPEVIALGLVVILLALVILRRIF